MKKLVLAINACALLVGASSFAEDQSSSPSSQSPQSSSQSSQSSASQSSPVGAEAVVTASATVDKVNKEDRKVTLKKEDGSMVTIKVPESVRNFDQIKAGDNVTAKYSESIAVGIRKSDEPASAIQEETVARAPAGAKPGAEISSTTQISATIDNIDKQTREVTLTKPDGSKTEVKVPEDVKKFDSLKKGDQVVVSATEALAIEVTPK